MKWTSLFFICSTIGAQAQSTWEWTLPDQGMQPSVGDIYYRDGHFLMTVLSREGVNGDLPTRSKLIVLNGSGEPVFEEANLLPDAEGVGASFVGGRGPGSPIYISGSCTVNGESGFFARTVSAQWELSAPSVITYPGYLLSTSENALPTSDGGLLIGGSLAFPPNPMPNRVALVKVGVDGSVVRDTVHGQGSGLSICRQVVEWNGQPWITVDGRMVLSNDIPSNSAFRIDPQLGVDQWFRIAGVDVDPAPPLDSIPAGVLDMVPISPTRYVVSGHGGEDVFPIIIVSDPTREVFHTFLPHSEYVMDHPAALQSLVPASNTALYYAVQENAQYGLHPPYTPHEPNRIHVYKLDTSLNVLCDHVLDGFADNMYYNINRIKATDDGGFVLIGARRDLDDPSGYFAAWARKFEAADCSVGISEVELRAAMVYPNPGQDGFQLLLNGEAKNGTMHLLDATGRITGQAVVQSGRAHFNAHGLPAGLYLYRVLDRSGAVRATGRWVKE